MSEEPRKPKVVLGLVEKEGNFLLIKRKVPELKLVWAFPGGLVEPEENEEQAVVRELFEEVGIKVGVKEKLFERKHPNTLVQIVYMSCYQIDEAEPRLGEPDEIVEVKWVPAIEVLVKFTSDVHPLIRDFILSFERKEEE